MTTEQPPVVAYESMQLDELLKHLDDARDQKRETPLLEKIWKTQSSLGPLWTTSAEPYQRIGRRLLKLGYPGPAGEVANAGLENIPKFSGGSDDVQLRRIQGLALARTGNAGKANEIALQLKQKGHTDEETLGLLARTYKDLALAATDEQARRQFLSQSLTEYAQAYCKPENYWTGINVATLSTILHQESRAREVAAAVRTQCLAEMDRLQQTGQDPYWALATLGEAALNLREWTAAEDWYRQAYAAAPKKYGDLITTRRQARWLMNELGHDANLVNQWLPIPKVVVFAGHMIDRPGRPQERFPARLAEAVKASMMAWLQQENALIGFSSAACGSDILFQQALHELGGETNLVLPFAEQEFEAQSVTFTGEEKWRQGFSDVIGNSSRTVFASQQNMKYGAVSYEYANLVLHGLAKARAQELETELVALAVWDGKPGEGPGGTADNVTRWRNLQVPIYRVDLSNLAAWEHGPPPVIQEPPSAEPGELDLRCSIGKTCIMALLFADAVNFRQLREEQVPEFVEYYLGSIAKLLNTKYRDVNPVRNTWGDGLYLVFESVQAAGSFALEFRDLIHHTKWADHGLPDLSVRIALHVGPVYYCVDPVIEQPNYTSTHVSRAARLEPKTAPGEVYASEGFAALAAIANVTGFRCEYVKKLAWDKHFGTFPTYVVKATATG